MIEGNNTQEQGTATTKVDTQTNQPPNNQVANNNNAEQQSTDTVKLDHKGNPLPPDPGFIRVPDSDHHDNNRYRPDAGSGVRARFIGKIPKGD